MNYTSKDILLQAVLQEPELIKFGQYDPNAFLTVDLAIDSINETVNTVGRIIDSCSTLKDFTEIYKEICNHIR